MDSVTVAKKRSALSDRTMIKQTVMKEDGRKLIFYSFSTPPKPIDTTCNPDVLMPQGVNTRV
ncbi:MAG: hypothetical protein K2Z81_15220, partial [Cyanobacteria bacterium]|nr:hypothetical protein [Cyanobacteriota bacterium]